MLSVAIVTLQCAHSLLPYLRLLQPSPLIVIGRQQWRKRRKREEMKDEGAVMIAPFGKVL